MRWLRLSIWPDLFIGGSPFSTMSTDPGLESPAHAPRTPSRPHATPAPSFGRSEVSNRTTPRGGIAGRRWAVGVIFVPRSAIWSTAAYRDRRRRDGLKQDKVFKGSPNLTPKKPGSFSPFLSLSRRSCVPLQPPDNAASVSHHGQDWTCADTPRLLQTYQP